MDDNIKPPKSNMSKEQTITLKVAKKKQGHYDPAIDSRFKIQEGV